VSSDDRLEWAPGQKRVGSVVNGKWQIDARLGTGGMATVYAATHRNGHRAALKMLHGPLSRDPPTRARFLREGYVANAVGHPGVVAVLDDGVAEDGCAFLVLELLEGETIDARRIRLGGALPVDEALDLADQALDALAAAHEKGIVHRDIKPENVFYTNEGRIKLLDFGLARMKDNKTEATKTGVTIGTPEFMPPEQALGRRSEVDARSDVWGLGATLFTAITGRYVHDDAQSLHEQLIASATRRSRPIRQLAPHVSPDVAAVIDKALELEMSDRWQSAREMQLALREARGDLNREFTADSMTVQSAHAPTSANPFSHEKPLSSDQTMKMQDAPRTQLAPQQADASPRTQLSPAGVGGPQALSALGVPRGAGDAARPASSPTGRGERKRIEDASDMEETFIEATHAAPIASLPGSRIPGSAPTAPHTSRMRDRPLEKSGPGGLGASGAASGLTSPPQPQRKPADAFRAPIMTPSDDHMTVQANVAPVTHGGSSNAPPPQPRVFSADAPTNALSPRSFPIDGRPLSNNDVGTGMSPRSFPVDAHPPAAYGPPVDAHGATVAVQGGVGGGGASPRAFRASAPPAPPFGHPQHASQPLPQLPNTGSHMIPPMAPIAQTVGPTAAQQQSSRVAIWVAIVFIVLAAAMAAYVVRRGGGPGSRDHDPQGQPDPAPTPVPMPPVK